MRRYSPYLSSVFVMVFIAVAPLCASVVSERGVGEQKVLVIMARFPDVQPSFSKMDLRNKYFHKLDHYLRAVSYQKAWLTERMTHWYTLPHRVAHYRISQRNLAVDKKKVTKLRLNWIEPGKIIQLSRGARQTVRLAPLSRGISQVLAVRLPIDATTYYLIENRQPIGPDRNLPSHGVLIYYCDDRIAECRHGQSPIKLVDADPSVPQLKGAPFTLEGKNMYKDEKRDISIKLVAQRGADYQIYVSNGE